LYLTINLSAVAKPDDFLGSLAEQEEFPNFHVFRRISETICRNNRCYLMEAAVEMSRSDQRVYLARQVNIINPKIIVIEGWVSGYEISNFKN
jgi:hypothetical protein